MRCGKRCGPGGVRALGGGEAIGMCTGRVRLKAVEVRARAERTPNMAFMFVTFIVLKSSGWLNTDASSSNDCRVERRPCGVGRGAAREA